MDRGLKNSQMATYTKAHTYQENHQDLENITGQMEAILKEFSMMESEMGKDYGKEDQEIVINMKDSIRMIRNQDMGYLHGLLEISTKEIIMKM